MFSFHVTFRHQTEDNITYSWSNSGLFSKHCSTIFVGESISILCLKLNARHCSTIYLYKKRYSAQHRNAHFKLGWVRLHHLRHLPSCALVPLAVRLIVSHIELPVLCCTAPKSRLWLVGLERMADFIYFELKRLNGIHWLVKKVFHYCSSQKVF